MTKLFKNSLKYAKTLIKWVFFAVLTGTLGGVLGSFFHKSIDYVTTLRSENLWLLWLLPIGGIVIAGMYSLFKKSGRFDTNRVLDAVSKDGDVPFVMTPLIFISASISHLLGASQGREGAALQLGGSLGYEIGKIFKLKNNDIHIIVMAGMSAVFSALFGTPIAAAVFAVEVALVGVFHYTALFASVVSAFSGYQVSLWLGVSPVRFNIMPCTGYTFEIVLKCAIIAIACALTGTLFCAAIKKSEDLASKYLKNIYLRGLVGGVIILGLTFLVRSYDYNGAGMNIVENAINGNAKPYAFILKILFTAISIAAGFKGGEIVPAFFIGSTLGCTLGSVLGIDAGFAAAIGFVSLFCSVTNCTIASIFLAVEIFGADWIVVFSLVCTLTYIVSGNAGLYKSQKIVFSKTDDNRTDINTK